MMFDVVLTKLAKRKSTLAARSLASREPKCDAQCKRARTTNFLPFTNLHRYHHLTSDHLHRDSSVSKPKSPHQHGKTQVMPWKSTKETPKRVQRATRSSRAAVELRDQDGAQARVQIPASESDELKLLLAEHGLQNRTYTSEAKILLHLLMEADYKPGRWEGWSGVKEKLGGKYLSIHILDQFVPSR